MKKSRIIWMLFAVMLVASCQVDELQSAGADQVIAGGVEVRLDPQNGQTMIAGTISFSGVRLLARIDNERIYQINECGLYYSKIPNFSLGQAMKVESSDLGNVDDMDKNTYSVTLSGLEDKTVYYYRFYVKHEGGLSLSALTAETCITTKTNYRVPETAITSESGISMKEVECSIVHNGNYEVTACGIYFGRNSTELKKIEATSWTMDGVKGSYKIDLSAEGLEINDKFYCQTYAVNQMGEGKGELTEMTLIRPKEYPTIDIVEIYMKDVTTSLFVSRLSKKGYGSIQEYGYIINKKKVQVGTTWNEGETITMEIPMSKGKEYILYPYAVNEDGESLEPDEPFIFTAGIPGKNEADKKCVYLELPAIEKEGVKYYFLDRNLGAIRAYETGSGPANSKDAGSAFQWGRSADGHQLWTVAAIKAVGSYPLEEMYRGHFLFNTSYKWTFSLDGLNHLWDNSEAGGENNPCPIGYRVPTKDEMTLFVENKSRMCSASTKLFRAASDGTARTNDGFYWTCTLEDNLPYQMSVTNAFKKNSSYGQGNFVRCVRAEK